MGLSIETKDEGVRLKVTVERALFLRLQAAALAAGLPLDEAVLLALETFAEGQGGRPSTGSG